MMRAGRDGRRRVLQVIDNPDGAGSEAEAKADGHDQEELRGRRETADDGLHGRETVCRGLCSTGRVGAVLEKFL